MTATIDWARWRESIRTPTPRAETPYSHERDEARTAQHTMTEMQRAHPRHHDAGMRLDDPEDIRWDDV